MNNKYPEVLYKYANWHDDNHKKLITIPEIYFCSPKNFNDPFDCSLRPRYDFTDEEKIKRIEQIIKIRCPHLTTEDIINEAKIVFNEKNFEKPEVIDKLKEFQNKYFYDFHGIFCLAALKNNFLMWSHYADGHKGFCIGYSTNKLEMLFNERYNHRDDIVVTGHSVEYAATAPIIKPDPEDINNDDDIITVIKVKPLDWQYEKEYRYVMTGSVNTHDNIDNFRKVIIEKDIIAEVILGCKITRDDKVEIYSYLKKNYPNTKIYQVIIKENSFNLEFVDINNTQ